MAGRKAQPSMAPGLIVETHEPLIPPSTLRNPRSARKAVRKPSQLRPPEFADHHPRHIKRRAVTSPIQPNQTLAQPVGGSHTQGASTCAKPTVWTGRSASQLFPTGQYTGTSAPHEQAKTTLAAPKAVLRPPFEHQKHIIIDLTTAIESDPPDLRKDSACSFLIDHTKGRLGVATSAVRQQHSPIERLGIFDSRPTPPLTDQELNSTEISGIDNAPQAVASRTAGFPITFASFDDFARQVITDPRVNPAGEQQTFHIHPPAEDSSKSQPEPHLLGPAITFGSNDMAAGFPRASGDARRHPSSSFNNSHNNNRYENQRPMSGQLCRNGPQCRKYQEGTCHFNHDFASMQPNGLSVPKNNVLTVDSPTFTPNFTPKPVNAQPAKMTGLSPKTLLAPTFTPSGSGSITPARGSSHSKMPSNEFIPQHFQPVQQFNEFVPGQSFVPQQHLDSPPQLQAQINPYSDPFLSQQALQQGIPGLDGSQQQINPYAQAASAVGGQPFYQDSNGYKHPLNYHLYASVGPRRENMQPYQRSSADFFIPDNLREDLHRKSEAALQTFANSTLPQSVEYFHSLVALDTSSQRSATTFGYPSWIYKATSSKDGHTYALRRIEGFRLTSADAIRSCQAWKRVSSASIVQIHDAFTGRWFGDSSLIVVTDYCPLAQTLAEKHFTSSRAGRSGAQFVPENELWGYIVQLASALRAVHEAGLAAQTVIASKILLTSKNRIRLSGCGVLDIVRYEQRPSVAELQRVDLEDLGRLILSIAARNPTAHQNVEKSLQFISRTYSERFRLCLAWLLSPPPSDQDDLSPTLQAGQASASSEYNIHNLLTNIADKVIGVMDSTLHQEDELTSNLMRELENGRLVRLLTKLNVILERPDTSIAPNSSTNHALLNQPSAAWSETGERYYLKLFRDYVFHQVDHEGRPVLDLGHIVTCLNKLDAGIDEKIQLVSRDEQNIMVVSYREVKRGFESAWTEISKASSATRR